MALKRAMHLTIPLQLLYNRHTTVKQSAETAEESLGEELGGTTSPTRMNTPTTSDDKGNILSCNIQVSL